MKRARIATLGDGLKKSTKLADRQSRLPNYGPQSAGFRSFVLCTGTTTTPRIVTMSKNVMAAGHAPLLETGLLKRPYDIASPDYGKPARRCAAATVTFRTAGAASSGMDRPCSRR